VNQQYIVGIDLGTSNTVVAYTAPGEQQVEHDRRVTAVERSCEAGGTVGARVDLEALGAQAALEHAPDRLVVLDHQHPHDR